MDVDQAAQQIWDYHHMNQGLQKADCIIVLGSSDIRVAEYAAEIFRKAFASHIVFSGGLGLLTKANFDRSEAEVFAEIAINAGVPKASILLEKKSTNTGDNIRFSIDLLNEHHISTKSVIIVTKPYMERRTFATAKKLFADKHFMVSSPPVKFANYSTNELPKELVINIMVGDLQRIMEYPAKGFQIEMEVPKKVKDAYNFLISAGFNKHLIKE